MTANADYGVSIVESFAPPANWLPGQEVNKDVYAVNTGNIAAFVKEELSGVLDYSYETLVSKFDANTCVELVPMADEEIDGATTYEAGSFLAWTDTDEPKGFKKSERTEDDTDNNAWHPTKTGHYIFRRSIVPAQAAVVDPETSEVTSPAVPEKYTYAGYYFVKGKDAVPAVTDPETGDVITEAQPAVPDKYYKIVIGKDSFRAATDNNGTIVKEEEDGSVRYEFDILCNQDDLVTATVVTDANGNASLDANGNAQVTETAITPNADGTFEKTPVISYVKVVDLDPQDVSFEYNTGADNKYGENVPYLMVRFNNAQGDLAARAKEVKAADDALTAAKAALVTAKENAAAVTHTIAELEIDYRNAEYAYYTAKARYDKTLADMTYANALVTATNKLYEPALNRANAEKQMETLKQAMEDAAKAVRDEANKEQGQELGDVVSTAFTDPNFNAVKTAMLDGVAGGTDTTTGIGSKVLVPQNIRNLINDNIHNATPIGGSDLTEAKRNLEVLDSIWKQIAGDPADATDDGILGKITKDYDNFEKAVAVGNKETDTKPETLDNVNPKGYLQDLDADLDRLEVLLKAYADAYTEFIATAAVNGDVETELTHLTNGTESLKARIQGYSKGDSDEDGTINQLESKAVKVGEDGLKDKIDAYKTAYNNYYNYMDSETGGYYVAVNAWNEAVKTYNNEVYNNDNSAKKTYDSTITTTKEDTKNLALENVTVDPVGTDGKKQLHSDGTALVAGFSAHSIGNNPAEPAADSNLTARPKGYADAGISVANTDATDPRIFGADTDYMKYVLKDTDYVNTLPFKPEAGEGHNSPYKTMSEVGEKAEGTFYQLNADPADSNPDDENSEKQLLSTLNTKKGNAQTEVYGSNGTAENPKANSAKEKYDTAVASANAEGGKIKALKDAEKAVTDAEKALEDARIAQAVQNTEGSNIKIDVVLDKNVIKDTAQPTDNATWVFDTATDNTQTPTFYYNRILDPGKTSEKLVDKLVFCDDVTAKDFTELTFDLNVALDSMQVTYDPQDNVTMTPTAVNASEDFDKTAEITNQGTKAVKWNTPDAVATVYKVDGNAVTINKLATPVVVGNAPYEYQIAGTSYYGVTKPEAGDTATYYKIDTTDSENPVLVTGEGSTVTVTAALAE